MISATVSIASLPDQYSPVNTDGLWFQFTSPSYTETSFTYITDVYSNNLFDGTQSLGRYRLPPRPDTGNGVLTPHKLLKTQIDNNPTTSIDTSSIPEQTFTSFVQYWLEYGYSLDPGLTFSNTFKITYNYLGVTASYLGLSFSTNPGLTLNDEVVLYMTNQKENISYNGSAIIASYSTDNVITSVLYGATPSSDELGEIINLIRINGTTETSLSTATGSNFTWNGTRQYGEKYINLGDTYVLNDNRGSVLSTYTYSIATQSSYATSSKPIFLKSLYIDQYDSDSFILNPQGASSSTFNGHIEYYGYNDSGVLVESAALGSGFKPENSKGRFEIGVGPKNLIELFGVTFSGVTWYSIILRTVLDTPLKTISRAINTTCTVFDIVQLRFLNQMGGYDNWNFIRNSIKTINTQKTEWKKQLAWDYNIGDRQETVLSQKAQASYKINTDWLNEYDYTYLSQLITSKNVYRVDGTYSIPIIITDTNWVQKKLITDQIFNLTISYRDGFNITTIDD